MAFVSNDALVIVGPTEGSYARTFVGSNASGIVDSEAVAVMLDTSLKEPTQTPTPTLVPTPKPTPTPTSTQESGMMIILIVAGSTAALLVAFLACFFYLRRRPGATRRSKNEGPLVATDGVVPVATDVIVSANRCWEGYPGTSNCVRITSSGIDHLMMPEAEVVQDDPLHPDGVQNVSIHARRAVFPQMEGAQASGSSSTSTSIAGDTATNSYELKPALCIDRTQLVRQGGKRSFEDPSVDNQTSSQQLSSMPGAPFNSEHQANGPVRPTGTAFTGASIEDCVGGGSTEDCPGTSKSVFGDGSKILGSSGAQSLSVQAIARSMLAAVERLTEHSSVPGVSEAATLLSMFVKLVLDSNDTAPASERRLRWCWSIMTLLGRTDKFLGEVRWIPNVVEKI